MNKQLGMYATENDQFRKIIKQLEDRWEQLKTDLKDFKIDGCMYPETVLKRMAELEKACLGIRL